MVRDSGLLLGVHHTGTFSPTPNKIPDSQKGLSGESSPLGMVLGAHTHVLLFHGTHVLYLEKDVRMNKRVGFSAKSRNK